MLVLTRKSGEAIVIDDRIVIRVDRVRGQSVKLYVAAPREIRIMRSEVAARDQGGDPSESEAREATPLR